MTASPDLDTEARIKKKKRSRSNLTKEEAVKVVEAFAARILRSGETSDPSMFVHAVGSFNGHVALPAFDSSKHLGVHLMIEGGFGDGSTFLEALRVLGKHRLPKLASKLTPKKRRYPLCY